MRRLGNAGLARVARKPAEAIHFSRWPALHLSDGDGNARRWRVRNADRYFQSRLSFSRRRAVAKDQARGAHRSRTHSPRFRPGSSGRRRTRGAIRAGHDRRGAGRRSRGARGEGFVALCKAAAGAAAQGYIVTLGIKPDDAGDGLWLYQAGKAGDARGRCVQGRSLRRKAQCRHGGKLCRRKLSLEFRQFLLPRRCDAGRVAKFRAGHGARGCGSRRQGQIGSEFLGPRQGSLREARRKNRSTMR